ncbi:uncharacterized protein [Diadema setosum]|uniref:uncharacterized protein n=1 Tax=Diadema setosum TaxID=31175 RepID=UPI003B3AA2A9
MGDVNNDLTPSLQAQVRELMGKYEDIFTDIPGRTTLFENDIELTVKEIPKSKPYPIPHALRETVQKERLRDANLTARPSKCSGGHSQVEFLGHVFGLGQVSPRPGKVESIMKLSRPETKKQLRSLLGMTNYYRKFISNYAAIAAPLTDKTKKAEPNKLEWGVPQEVAFNTLKNKLDNAPILHLPDLNLPFVLRTDASEIGVGAVLLQAHGDTKFAVAYI